LPKVLIRADFHTHSIGDGTFGANAADLVAAHLEAAMEAGLDCIGVTDHDDLRPGLIAVEYAAKHSLPILVIPGMEITTDEGQLVGLGLSSPLPRWKSMTETAKAISARKGISILPHPFFPQLRERNDVNAIERFNSRYGDFPVEENGVAIIASSDAHSPADLHASPYHVLVEVQELTWAAVSAAILERRVQIATEQRSLAACSVQSAS
jgi:predicted metal-dependent phosphoesterase TrpH